MKGVSLNRIVLEAHKVILKHEAEMLIEQIERESKDWPPMLAPAFAATRMAVFTQYAKIRIMAVLRRG